jgi:hypothetical protein
VPAIAHDPAGVTAAAPVVVPALAVERAGPSPWERWAGHLVEMLVAMMLGMHLLAYPGALVAGALGYPDLRTAAPGVVILVMAVEMTLPMALWMAYRGHRRRAVLEMSAVMAVPAAALAAAAGLGLLPTAGLASAYHAAMMAAMVGYMLYRRDEYSCHP